MKCGQFETSFLQLIIRFSTFYVSPPMISVQKTLPAQPVPSQIWDSRVSQSVTSLHTVWQTVNTSHCNMLPLSCTSKTEAACSPETTVLTYTHLNDVISVTEGISGGILIRICRPNWSLVKRGRNWHFTWRPTYMHDNSPFTGTRKAEEITTET